MNAPSTPTLSQLASAGRPPLTADDLGGVPAWEPVHLYGFLNDEGCGGTDLESVVATCHPLALATVEAMRDDLDKLRLRYYSHAPKLPDLDTWPATMGEYWDRCDELRAEAAAARAAQLAEQAAATESAMANHGLVTLHGAQKHMEVYGWEYGNDTNPRLPLSVIVNHGCRCGHGGSWVDDDLVGPDFVPEPAWLCRIPDDSGRMLVSVAETPPTGPSLAAALDAAAQSWTNSLTAAAAQFDARVAASATPIAELEAMTPAEYTTLVNSEDRSRGSWPTRRDQRPTQRTPPELDIRTALQNADRAHTSSLRTAELYIASNSAEPPASAAPTARTRIVG